MRQLKCAHVFESAGSVHHPDFVIVETKADGWNATGNWLGLSMSSGAPLFLHLRNFICLPG